MRSKSIERKISTAALLSQAYSDNWDYYQKSLKTNTFPVWDYVFLTASNNHQALMYRQQLNIRKDYLPKKTKYIVIPDEKETRIGSGGATLSVIKYIRENNKTFDGLKMLVIHSGGDSKRIPQYSASGKLFSPVPHVLGDGRNSTLFDELMITVSVIPSRIKEGMMLMSGDVMLLFNPLLIEFGGKGAISLSFKEKVAIGKNHGVFLENGGYVKDFLHKQTVETLKKKGASDNKGMVNIDTGAMIFGKDVLVSLWSLISTDDAFDEYKYNSLVNKEVCLSLYGDFLYPLADNSSLEDFYLEKPENQLNDALKNARKKVWDVLNQYRLKLMCFYPAKFIHFGTSKEIKNLMSEEFENYKDLGWSNNINSVVFDCAGYNSILDHNAFVGKKCYLENSYVCENIRIGNNVILSCVEINEGIEIPDDVVIHCLKQLNGKYVCRIYGINDNPKENRLFDVKINDSLWNTELYPECNSMSESIDYALRLYDCVKNNRLGEIDKWKNKKSLCSGFNNADPEAIVKWDEYVSEMVQVYKIEEDIDNKVPVSELNADLNELSDTQNQWLSNKIDKSALDKKMRLYFYFGKILNDENMKRNAFKCLSEEILNETLNGLQERQDIRICHNELKVSLPLRVNWGGGWSDTPPYCNENGGTVLNAAIVLNNERPVSVTLRRIKENKIIFESKDMGVYGEFDSLSNLQSVGDPYDPFVLQKSALLACGIIPKEGSDLDTVLNRLGSGFYMNSEVTNVPKGSGLGTSSILAAACVKALFEFMDIGYSERDLYSHVLVMEQLMSTGGGWQDQVGGVIDGIKLISSKPGIRQELNVEHITIDENVLEELNSRFALIYTGQRRLARNLLRDVIGRYIGNEKDCLYALKEIQNLAIQMKDELVNGDIDEFANLLSKHWEFSKMIDEGSTNKLINQIFDSINDMISGKMICGAGGGGFLQVVLKKGISKEALHDRLSELYPDTGIDVWNCKIV